MAEAQAQSGRTKIHYGWVIVGMSFVALMVSAGMRSAPTVLIVPLEHEFGWSRATISLAIALQLFLYGLVGPFSAGCIDRFGVRRTLIGALILTLVGIGFTPFIRASWNLWPLWGVALGSGTGAAAMVMAAMVANRWFVARRGVVMGFLTGSTAAGQLVFLPLLASVVAHWGWRTAVLVGASAVVATIPLAWLLIRDHPAEMGLRAYGAAHDVPVAVPARVNPFKAAMTGLGMGIGHRDFWLLSAGFFVCGASTLGLVGTHFIPACVDHGIAETTAAGLIAFMGVFNLFGTTASGWLTDRFDSRWLLFWYYALRGVSLLFLPYAFDLSFWGLTVFGIFYGLDWIATVPPTVRLAANAFGVENAGMMYGWIMVIHQVGSATAAYGAGLLHTDIGNYNAAFIGAGGLCMIAAVLSLRVGVGRTPRAQRPVLATAES